MKYAALLLMLSGCLGGECLDQDCLQRSPRETAQGLLLVNETDVSVTWHFHAQDFVTGAREHLSASVTCMDGELMCFGTEPAHAFPVACPPCGRGSVTLRATP